MNVFDYQGNRYISINGKSFFLFCGYGKGDILFAQIAGNAPLYPEDLPYKNWALVKTKWQKIILYTAYQKDYHSYQSDRIKGRLLFPAKTRQGSYFLLHKHLNEKYGLNRTDTELSRLPEEPRFGFIEKLYDRGNSGTEIYLLDFDENTGKRLQTINLKE